MAVDPDSAGSGRGPQSGSGDGDVSGLLRIIATSDLHGQFLSYDYFANRQLSGRGLAQIACLIEEARRGASVSLLLDNGDFLQGGALAEPCGPARGRRPHPAINAFTTLGYDAVGLGNHEFDYGLDHLNRIIDGTDLPVLSANVLRHQGGNPISDRHYTRPALITTRDIDLSDGSRYPVTIGIFALTPPETMQWNARWIQDRLRIRPMEETARAWVPELRRRGADIVICLAHTGVAQPSSPAPGESQAAIIAAIPGIDAVIAGHSHLTFPDQRRYGDPQVDGQSGHIAGIPVVQPGHEGSHLGVIDLWLGRDTRAGNRAWRVTRSRSQVIAGPAALAEMPARRIREASAPLRVALARDHTAALFRMRQSLGRSTLPLSTWFATVADSQATRLIGAALSHHVRARLAQGKFADMPVVALVHSFRAGGRGGPMNYTDIPPGNLSLRHVCGLYPFPNTLTALLIDGAGLSARLDHATALFCQIRPDGADQKLINPAIPAFSFASAVGASYRIDLSTAPPAIGTTGGRAFDAGRIRDLRIAGRLLAPDDPVILVVNNYVSDALPSQPPDLPPSDLPPPDLPSSGPGFGFGFGFGSDQPDPGHPVAGQSGHKALHPRNKEAGDRRGSPHPPGNFQTGQLVLDEGRLCTDIIADYIREVQRITPDDSPGWRFCPMPGTTILFDSGSGAAARIDSAAGLRPEPLGLLPSGFSRFRLHL